MTDMGTGRFSGPAAVGKQTERESVSSGERIGGEKKKGNKRRTQNQVL